MLPTLYDYINRWVDHVDTGLVTVKLPASHRAILVKLITLLGDRRLLAVLECEIPRCDMVESCNKIRENLNEALVKVGADSRSRTHLIEIRVACHNFQKFMEEHLDCGEYSGEPGRFFIELGALRGVTGQSLAKLCGTYEIDVDRDLKHLLPTNDDNVAEPPIGSAQRAMEKLAPSAAPRPRGSKTRHQRKPAKDRKPKTDSSRHRRRGQK